jgi:epoxyqueuosine reductase QueG
LADAEPDLFERMDQPEFTRRFGDTPLERPGLQGMRRNFRAALAHGRARRYTDAT